MGRTDVFLTVTAIGSAAIAAWSAKRTKHLRATSSATRMDNARSRRRWVRSFHFVGPRTLSPRNGVIGKLGRGVPSGGCCTKDKYTGQLQFKWDAAPVVREVYLFSFDTDFAGR